MALSLCSIVLGPNIISKASDAVSFVGIAIYVPRSETSTPKGATLSPLGGLKGSEMENYFVVGHGPRKCG